MSVRILHCGKSLTNYYACINEKVAGFTRRGPNIGDIVYLVVKPNKKTFCGARGKLTDISDNRPWENAEAYPQSFVLGDLEFCEPFEINVLSEAGGPHWNLKYLQGAKSLDAPATTLLERIFSTRLTETVHVFDEYNSPTDVIEEDVDDDDATPAQTEITDANINIMGTFLTVKFHSEQHRIMGLESLVNKNFYQLFEEYPEERTILISDNRMFQTAGITNSRNERLSGISGIPDAILIKFDKDAPTPLQINLIEYECYGEVRTRSVDKFNYLNGHIIPQLMRFASTFSVVTDSSIRDQTVRNWTEKIIEYIYSDDELTEKVASWIRRIYPDLREQQISLHFNNLLINAFKANIRVILIIDELTSEQKDTIKNVVNSFKLENGANSVDFTSYVVRLQQRINMMDTNSDYAISIQK